MLTLNQAATTLGISPRTVQRKAKSGDIERVVTTQGVRYVVPQGNIRRAPAMMAAIEHPDAIVEEIFHLRAEMESLRRRVATQTREIEELRSTVGGAGLYVRPLD